MGTQQREREVGREIEMMMMIVMVIIMIHYYTRTKMKAQLAFKKRKEKEKKKRGGKKRVCLTLCPMTERKGGDHSRWRNYTFMKLLRRCYDLPQEVSSTLIGS